MNSYFISKYRTVDFLIHQSLKIIFAQDISVHPITFLLELWPFPPSPRPPLAVERLCEIAHACERVWMIVSQDHLSFCPHFLVHLCSFCEFSLLSIRQGEIAHACERVWMIVSQDHFSLCPHFLVHLCSLCEFSLLSIRLGEIVHVCERVWMIVSQDHPTLC